MNDETIVLNIKRSSVSESVEEFIKNLPNKPISIEALYAIIDSEIMSKEIEIMSENYGKSMGLQ